MLSMITLAQQPEREESASHPTSLLLVKSECHKLEESKALGENLVPRARVALAAEVGCNGHRARIGWSWKKFNGNHFGLLKLKSQKN